MKNDDRMTARLTARFALAGCAALLPLSIAWAAAPPLQTPQSEAPEKPSTAQETQEPEAPEEKTPKPVETPKEEPAKTGQDETGKPGDDSELDELNPFRGGGAGGADPQAEMRELFLKVDKRLNRVTELLFEASAGDMSSAGEIGSAGIDELIREAESQAGGARSDIAKLLEASRSQSEAASGEIGRILEIAQQQSSSGGSSGQQQGQPQPGEGQPQQGQTPSGSRREDKGERGPQGENQQEEPGGQDPGSQEQDQPGDGQPEGSQDSDQQDQRPGDDPPGSETGDPADARGNENWGELPVHLRRVFENSVSDDVPARYRDWVDSYYKRLARRSGR